MSYAHPRRLRRLGGRSNATTFDAPLVIEGIMGSTPNRTGHWLWYIGITASWLIGSSVVGLISLSFWSSVLDLIPLPDWLPDPVYALAVATVFLVGAAYAWGTLRLGAPSNAWLAFAAGSAGFGYLAFVAASGGANPSLQSEAVGSNVGTIVAFAVPTIGVPGAAFLLAKRRDAGPVAGVEQAFRH